MENNRCPFCGGLSLQVIDTRETRVGDDLPLFGLDTPCYVLCRGCQARGPVVMLDSAGGVTPQAAVDVWRERTDLEPVTEGQVIET